MTWMAVSMEAATATMAFLGLAACRSLRRTRGRARLPVPLHVSGGDREQQTPLALDDRGVTFRWEDDRARAGAKSREWIEAMTLPADEFIRGFLLHVLPDGFHPIRHYGLFASGTRAVNISRIRNLLAPVPSDQANPQPAHDEPPAPACPCCGGRLVIVERFRSGMHPRAHPTAVIRIDTS